MGINISGMVDKRNIYLLLGCYCNDPRLAVDEKYQTTVNDYSEAFHKMIWSAIVNIAKKGKVSKISAMEIENEISQFSTALTLWKNNDGWNYIEKAIEDASDKLLNVGYFHDVVRKYSIIRNASEMLKLDITFIYDENDEVKINLFNQMTSSDVLSAVNNKFIEFKGLWKNSFGDNYSFHAGDGINERLNEHKAQSNTYGYPFQSGYLTTIFRGMKSKKMLIRSSPTGGGKTRGSLADACNISCDKIYDWSKLQWISTGEKKSTLFISTELTKEEIQDCLLAHVSGIEEDRISEWRDITEQEEIVLQEAIIIVADSLLYGEYQPDFTIDSINELVEQYIINKKVEYVFFDYINDSPELYKYYYEKTKTRLRTDQILFLFSTALKQTCNKYNVYLGTSTQLNDSYKDEDNKDASAIKGSKSICEKADQCVLALPVTSKDLIKLKPILEAEGRFNVLTPTMAYYVFKNRGGKWKSVIVWTKLNMGTMREVDCFVTNYNFELIQTIEQTVIEFKLDDVGDVKPQKDAIDINAENVIHKLLKT